MKKLNIYELHSEMNRRKQNRTKSLDHVLERCHNKIRNASKKELARCLFDVPEFVIGLPVYNLNDCIIHLMTSLNQNGFVVKYYFPKLLYISWDFDEINHSQNNALSKELISYAAGTNPNPEMDHLRSMDKMLLTSAAQKSFDGRTREGTPHSPSHRVVETKPFHITKDGGTTSTNRRHLYPSSNTTGIKNINSIKSLKNLPNGKFVLNLD
jgi:hypothetical protein